MADPLLVTGRSNVDKEQTQVYLSLVNEGWGNIKIEEVAVNSKAPATNANFVMSYTGQLVSAGIEDSSQAQFIGIDEGIIPPQLSDAEVRQILRDNEGRIPLHYGVRIVNDENIHTVHIQYRYLGISRTKTVVL
ncbi:hypothetical protein DNH61_02450 [Paenibacillus sambharensis]|uniref:Uncharacterized protein n=1 Tax=Paenibacillus sambharensis TaxID=1803190 RepID=A0A2W1LR65_9BACL|nr:hypothetical protein [Paenibacillus sambharensis]PZD97452.1 hypothetical protein DNH61_02450 [Paenibacillus sambharensis]